MKIYLFIVIAFLLAGCTVNDFNASSNLSSDEQLANEITKKVATKLKEKYDLQPCGSGGQMMYEIKMLALSFFYYKDVNIDEARKLLIAAVNEFKDAINNDERIRPYLFNYPFEAKNIQIRIVIKNPDRSSRDNGTLCAISAIDNVLEYETRESKNKLLETIYQETYEEALQKIQEESIKKEQY